MQTGVKVGELEHAHGTPAVPAAQAVPPAQTVPAQGI